MAPPKAAPSHVVAQPLALPDPIYMKLTKEEKCAKKTVQRILSNEKSCIRESSKPKHRVCRKFKVRDDCRVQSIKEARKWSKKCGAPVVLAEFTEEAPEDCKLCVKGANLILQECVKGRNEFKDRCMTWIVAQRKVECFNKQYRHFAKICGKRQLRVLDYKPEKKPKRCSEDLTEKCAEKGRSRIKEIFTACLAKAKRIQNPCDAFKARLRCWGNKHKRAAFWTRYCKTLIFYPMLKFNPPPNCLVDNSNSEENDGQGENKESSENEDGGSDGFSHEWYHHAWDSWYSWIKIDGGSISPITCEEKASENINLKFAACEQASELRSDQCRKLAHLRHCNDEKRARIVRWNTRCGINMPVPQPIIGLPINCAQNTGISCANTANKEINTSLKECLAKTKTMKMNTCRLLQYTNGCYLASLNTQIEKYRECSWNWVNLFVKFEYNSECPMKGCVSTGKSLISKINDACKDSVANSKLSRSDKAHRINACLLDYDFVPKFFNQTCDEKMLRVFSYEDESVCTQT